MFKPCEKGVRLSCFTVAICVSMPGVAGEISSCPGEWGFLAISGVDAYRLSSSLLRYGCYIFFASTIVVVRGGFVRGFCP